MLKLIYDRTTHFIGRLTRKHYYEDFQRVYPDNLVFNKFGRRREYTEVDRRNYLNHYKFYKFASQFVIGRVVGDIGCGSGYGCKILKESGARSVFGSDISKSAISRAKLKFGEYAEYSIQTCTDLQLYKDNSFDVTICSEVLEHIKEYSKEAIALKEMRRVTKRNGIIVLGTPNSELLGEHGFSFSELSSLVGRQFDSFVIFENALIDFGPDSRKMWEERLASNETGIIVTENINLSETVLHPDFDFEESDILSKVSLPTESGNIRMNIDAIQEVIKDKRGFIEIAGWAHIEGKNSENSRIHVVLKSDSNTYIFNTALRKRPDITNFFKTLQSHLDLDDAGFFTRIPQEKIKKDKYTVGIYIIRGDVEALQYGEIIVEKGIELTLRISKLRNESETCNWEYIVQTVNDRCILKVRPLNTVYANELSKPLMYPIERNDIDFEIIDSFLFDLTNSCNLRCPFCYSSPQNKPVKLTDFDYQVISEILRNLRSEGKLQYIQVGCDFEPLLSDKFESYAEAFKQLFKGPGAPLIGIITNGILLDPNKLKYYSSAAGSNLFVHISFHSHKKEVFGSYIKRLDFNKLVNNIITIREFCPDVRIELCNVLTKLNFIDIPGYLDYVFNQLKVNIVHFRRPDLSPLSDDRRAQLELEPGKFAELHDWLSISDSYMVLKTVDMNSSVFSVYRIEQPEAGFLLEKTRGF